MHFGKYELVETKAPNGYVASEKSWNVTLSYADQETEIVTEDITVTNTPNEVKVKKVDADSQEALAGVEFQVWKKGKLTTVVIYTKMCRGEMARYIIKNRIEKPEELKSFNWEGFCFDAEHSTESQYLFSLLS